MNDGDIQDMEKVHFALLLLLIVRKSSSLIVKRTPSHSSAIVWEVLGKGLPVIYLNVFWIWLNVMSTSKKCSSFFDVFSMHIIYKQKNLFRKHKYALCKYDAQIWLRTNISFLNRRECLLFCNLWFPRWVLVMIYKLSFHKFKENLCPKNVWM